MAEVTYSAGISFSWLDLFYKSLDNHPKMRKDTMCSIAHAINFMHHLKKENPQIKMSHKLLERYGLNRKSIVSYLEVLQEAGIISFQTKVGSSPQITLIIPPVRTSTKKTYKETKDTVRVSQTGQVGVPNRTGGVSQTGQVATNIHIPSTPPNPHTPSNPPNPPNPCIPHNPPNPP